MKRLLMMIYCLFTSAFVVMADDDKLIAFEQLPTNAQAFVESNFPNHKVAKIKMESDFFDKNYNVMFTNGDNLEFDEKGNWSEIDCKYSEVPSALVPKTIADFVNQHYQGQKIVDFERSKRDYEIQLSNGVEIKFDLRYRVIDIDR